MLTPTFPAPSGLPISSVESRRALAGLVIRDAAGAPRAGVFPRGSAPLVTARASMAVDVAAFEAVLVRNGMPAFSANDGAAPVALSPAPAANSRIDVVWAKQNESAAPFSDASNAPTFGVTAGVAAASPVKPAIPAGALELGTVLVPSTATTAQSANVVITQTYPMTALTGTPIPIRALTELAGTWAAGTRAELVGTGIEYEYLADDGVRTSEAGWFRRRGSLTVRSRDTVQNVNNGTNTTPISYTVAEMTPEQRDFAYAGGTFTCVRAGTYLVTVAFGMGQQGAAVGYLASLRKNGAVLVEAANSSSTTAATSATLPSYAVALVPGDTIAVTAFANIAAPGIGTDATAGRNKIELLRISA